MTSERKTVAQVYWGPVYNIAREGDDLKFLIKDDKVLTAKIGSKATKLMGVPLVGPTRDRPWTKYFRYVTLDDGTNSVIHTENRAVDCVPIDLKSGEYFLIRRIDSGKLAVPGGIIDSDEISSPTKAHWQKAALRELQEETGIRPDQLLTIHQLSDVLIKGDDPREHTMTMPFAVIIQSGVRGFGADDAVAEPMVGFKFDTVPPLAFTHHQAIIEMAVGYARSLQG